MNCALYFSELAFYSTFLTGGAFISRRRFFTWWRFLIWRRWCSGLLVNRGADLLHQFG
jgi:hypothetical protein